MDNLSLREQLENRLLNYSIKIHDLIMKLPKDRINKEIKESQYMSGYFQLPSVAKTSPNLKSLII